MFAAVVVLLERTGAFVAITFEKSERE